MQILNAASFNYDERARNILLKLGELTEQNLDRADLLASIKNYEILIVRLGVYIDREILDAARNLKVIVTATTGLDHIDIPYAQQCGITVLSLRGETDFLRTIPATAELTWGLILSLKRRIPTAHQSVLNGNWNRDSFRGNDLAGSKLGILGLGRIGEKIAQYGLAFDMQVIAYDPYKQSWPPNINNCDSIKRLCQQSDILSIHVPLNDETRKLISAKEISWMPPNGILINTARGAIVDEKALLSALINKKLAGAALDVISDENLVNRQLTNLLIQYACSHDNLILTPHIGGATVDSMHSTELFMAKKLAKFMGKSLIPIV